QKKSIPSIRRGKDFKRRVLRIIMRAKVCTAVPEGRNNNRVCLKRIKKHKKRAIRSVASAPQGPCLAMMPASRSQARDDEDAWLLRRLLCFFSTLNMNNQLTVCTKKFSVFKMPISLSMV